MKFLDKLSLRQRFLVAPLLGIVLIGLLTVAFTLESHRQNALLDRLTGTDLLRFEQHAAALNNLTSQHLQLYGLFVRADAMNEAELYDRTKAHLREIQDTLDRLDDSLNNEGEHLNHGMVANHHGVHALARAYLDEATSAIGMATVDVVLAPRHMVAASESFVAMSQAFVDLLEAEQSRIDREVAMRIDNNRTLVIVLAFGGIACAGLLLVIARGFAVLLGRSLENQIGTLTALGAQAGSGFAAAGRTELERIASATDAFRHSLLELHRARDELELRVEERTRELQQANEEVRANAEALRESFEKFRRNERSLNAIVEFVGEAIITVDEAGLIHTYNRAAQRAFGYDPREAVGKSISMLLPGEQDASQEDRPNESALRAFCTVDDKRDLKGRRKDGSLFDIELSVSAMEFEGKRRFIGVCSDVTARREAEETLRRAKEQAEAANRAKSEFLATMSHEIRTPMNGVVGMADLLLDTSLDDEQRQYAAAVMRSAQALLTVINDVLDFSKLEAGRLELENADFNTVDVVEDVAELLRPRAVDPGIDLVTFIAPNVPRYLSGDAGRLRQVLLNLAGNAVKFTEVGCVAITATVARIGDNGVTLRYEVIDTGIGIPEEVQARLFERFTQGDASTTRQYGGTGLGLAISKQIVELMEGEIGVQSRPGMGSTFWFTTFHGNASRNAGGEDQPLSDLSGLRILVVDDIELNRTIFQKQLESWGVEVVAVADGEAALAMIGKSAGHGMPFDAAIVDHAMPGMDGEELARRIAGDPDHSAVRLLLASSLDLRKDVERLRQIGFSECLCKPVRQSELFATLADICSRPSAVRGRDAAVPTPDGTAAAPRDANGPARELRILLAEDNRTNELLVTATLTKHGHRVDIARNGLEAVHAVRHETYDLVLMDVNMPEMDGVAATAAIRDMDGARGRVPIIALTANAMEGDRERFLAAGMDDYLSKPIDRQKLIAMVNAIGELRNESGKAASPASTEASSGVNVLDLAVLEDWQSFLPKDDFANMVDVQMTDSLSYLQQIREAMEQGAFEAMGGLAHDLKSSAGAIGMVEVQRLAERMEHACRDGRHDEALALAPAVVAAVVSAVDALKARIAA